MNDQQSISRLLEHRVELLNLAASSPRSADLIAMYADDFESTRMVYLPDGEVQKTSGDLADLKRVISNFTDSPSNRIVSRMDTIHYLQIFDRTAVVIFSGSYNMIETETNTSLYEGMVINTMYLRNTPNGWKIADQYSTEVRGSISKYPCRYELYQKDANEMLLSVKVPDGQSFAQKYLDVNFSEMSGTVTLIRTNHGDEFAWENNTLRVLRENAGTSFTGRPNSKTAVCEELVLYYYGDVCSGVKLEK